MLKKDKKESNFEALNYAVNTLKLVANMVNSEDKMPKRAKLVVGKPIMDRALEIVEDLREANSIFGDNKNEITYRIKLGEKAASGANRLHTDITYLPYMVSSIKEDAPWYKELDESSYNLQRLVHNWQKSDFRAQTAKKEAMAEATKTKKTQKSDEKVNKENKK